MENEETTVTDVVNDRALSVVKKLREKLTDSELILLSRSLDHSPDRLSELLTAEVAKVISKITGESK